MIRNFRHNGLRRFWERGERRRVPPEHADRIRRILTILDDPAQIRRLGRARYRLHRLTGNLAGYWAVTVSANWRIIFRFEGEDVCDVDLIDYH